MTWTIKPYTPGDEQDILALRQRVFGNIDTVRSTPDGWWWQFGQNPAGTPTIFLAWDHNKRLGGQYAVIPARMALFGRTEIFHYSCDTMVDPSARRQGLFVSLAREAYSALEKNQASPVVYGFPNKNSMPGFVRSLGWRKIDRLPTWVCPAVPGKRKDPAPGVCARPVTRFGPEFDHLWETHAPDKGVVRARDAQTLNWRYFGLPAFGYRATAFYAGEQILGYLVWRPLALFGLRVAALADMFPFPIQDTSLARSIAAWFRREAARSGCVGVAALFPPAGAAHAQCMGFIKAPGLLSPKSWDLGARIPEGSPLARPEPWHITLGDTDIV